MASVVQSPRVPFNVGDAVEHAFDRPDEPQTIHLELHLDGARLDADRFAAAWRSAVTPHPFARAGVVNDWAGPAWIVRPPEEAAPLVAESSRPVDAVRAEAVSRLVDLAVSPLDVTRCLADGGDVVVVVINHSAMDGVSALRLLRGASLAYDGRHEVPNGPDALDVHDLRGFAVRPRPTWPSLPSRPARVRPGDGAQPGAAGYAVCLRTARPPS